MGKTLSLKAINSAVAVMPIPPGTAWTQPDVIRDLYGLTEDGKVYRFHVPTKGGNGYRVALPMEAKE